MESSTRQIMGSEEINQVMFCTGLALAVLSSLFIGSSFIIKKLSLLRLTRKGSLRAGAGGFGYLKDWMWWLGFLTMGIGELANFAAYAFAPASLVTPLGALSVLVSAILSSKFLNESLNTLGKVGCFLCILGTIIVIMHSPREREIKSLSELFDKLQDSTFLNYVVIVFVATFAIVFYLGPRYGSQHVLVYVTLCSAVGSLTVMACKGLGLAIGEALSNGPTTESNSYLHMWLTCVLLVVVVSCILIQMNYLNKALDLFNTSLVTPVYYVMFTTLVIIASAILFKEWGHISSQDAIGNICGFLIIITAIFLLQGFKDSDVSFDGFRFTLRPRQSMLRNGTMKGESKGEYGSSLFLTRTV